MSSGPPPNLPRPSSPPKRQTGVVPDKNIKIDPNVLKAFMKKGKEVHGGGYQEEIEAKIRELTAELQQLNQELAGIESKPTPLTPEENANYRRRTDVISELAVNNNALAALNPNRGVPVTAARDSTFRNILNRLGIGGRRTKKMSHRRHRRHRKTKRT
jgi:hypothetical protein